MRREQNDKRWLPPMPPIDVGKYLIDYLMEVGPTLAGAMGPVPLTFEEMGAWSRATGLDLLPWEVRCLRRLSLEYANEGHAAQKADADEPWTGDERKRVTAQQLAFRRMAGDL